MRKLPYLGLNPFICEMYINGYMIASQEAGCVEIKSAGCDYHYKDVTNRDSWVKGT